MQDVPVLPAFYEIVVTGLVHRDAGVREEVLCHIAYMNEDG